MKRQTRGVLLLMMCSLVWGTAFAAQSAGAEVGPYAFLACRSWLAVPFLLVLSAVMSALRRRRGESSGWPKTAAEKRDLYGGGFLCGTMLFLASAAQQVGITLDPSTAKAGFLTAMYVVLVPVLGLFLHRPAGRQLWVCVAMTVLGLYLLCMQGGFGVPEKSDLSLMLCALLFSGQIMLVDRYSPRVDGVQLSFMEFLVTACWSTLAALLLETPSPALIAENALPILYCGIFSSGVAYTLQIVGQRDVDPALASLAMCLESVFAALSGWLLLGQSLTPREMAGGALIFAAVVLAQLPLERLLRRKRAV